MNCSGTGTGVKQEEEVMASAVQVETSNFEV